MSNPSFNKTSLDRAPIAMAYVPASKANRRREEWFQLGWPPASLLSGTLDDAQVALPRAQALDRVVERRFAQAVNRRR